MPNNMTMKHPHPRTGSPEAQHRMAPARDIHRVAEHGAREAVPIWLELELELGLGLVLEGIERAPAQTGFVDGEDVEVVAVLGRVCELVGGSIGGRRVGAI